MVRVIAMFFLSQFSFRILSFSLPLWTSPFRYLFLHPSTFISSFLSDCIRFSIFIFPFHFLSYIFINPLFIRLLISVFLYSLLCLFLV
jgi:hypothetical protein